MMRITFFVGYPIGGIRDSKAWHDNQSLVQAKVLAHTNTVSLDRGAIDWYTLSFPVALAAIELQYGLPWRFENSASAGRLNE
jgi:hypothetical protein